MNAVLGGQLCDRLLILEESLDDLRLEGGRKLLAHIHDLSRRATHPHCPDSGVHRGHAAKLRYISE